jgi:hypothetical protein
LIEKEESSWPAPKEALEQQDKDDAKEEKIVVPKGKTEKFLYAQTDTNPSPTVLFPFFH